MSLPVLPFEEVDRVNIIKAYAAIAAFALSTYSGFAIASPFSTDFDIVFNDETVGAVDVHTYFDPAFPGQEGLKGAFGVLKQGDDGQTLTLQELEQYLEQDHLNWFQKVLSLTPAIPGVPTPFIDPPRGGMPGVWADMRPWYFDETPPPPGTNYNPNRQLQQQADPNGSILNYFDTPNGQPAGTRTDFVTYLISDYGDRTYRVLGGFAWSSEIQSGGNAEIVALMPAGIFQHEYRSEIALEFGYDDVETLLAQVSEPDTFLMTTVALCWLALRRHSLRRKAVCGGNLPPRGEFQQPNAARPKLRFACLGGLVKGIHPLVFFLPRRELNKVA
jgi:hypothetical protein